MSTSKRGQTDPAKNEVAILCAHLEAQEAENARLRRMLGQCYAMAGADTDGDPPERHAVDALAAVTQLRVDYDEACGWQARADKAEALLRKAGIVVVEAADQSDVRLLSPEAPPVDGGALLLAAMKTLAHTGDASNRGSEQRGLFTKLLAEYLGKPLPEPPSSADAARESE